MIKQTVTTQTNSYGFYTNICYTHNGRDYGSRFAYVLTLADIQRELMRFTKERGQ